MPEIKTFNLTEMFRTFWPVVLVVVSLAAQWAILGQRVSASEEKIQLNTVAITEIRGDVQETKQNYAALEEKVDGIKESVDYIRNRIDRALTN